MDVVVQMRAVMEVNWVVSYNLVAYLIVQIIVAVGE